MRVAEYRAAAPSLRLVAIADALQDTLFKIETLEQAMIKIQGGEWQAEREAVFRALAACESLIMHLLAIGADAKTAKRALPAWLPPLLGQLDSAFLANLPTPAVERADA